MTYNFGQHTNVRGWAHTPERRSRYASGSNQSPRTDEGGKDEAALFAIEEMNEKNPGHKHSQFPVTRSAAAVEAGHNMAIAIWRDVLAKVKAERDEALQKMGDLQTQRDEAQQKVAELQREPEELREEVIDEVYAELEKVQAAYQQEQQNSAAYQAALRAALVDLHNSKTGNSGP